jgi:CBS domain-containing protein
MDRNPPVAPASEPLALLSRRIAGGDPVLSRRQATLLVDDAGLLAGILTRGDLMRALHGRAYDSRPSLDIAATDVEVTYPDETLLSAFARMSRRGVGRLPVVEGPDSHRVVGYLGRADILAARTRLIAEEEHLEKGPILAGK